MKATTTNEPLPTLHDANEVAKALGITAWGVRNLHRVGRLRGILVNRKLRFTVDAVRQYVESLAGDVA